MEQLMTQLRDTDFLINESRLRQMKVSCDTYAQDWIPEHRRDSVRALWEESGNQVHPRQDLSQSLRSRFFLKQLQRFPQLANRGIFINFGAGLSSYQYLIQQAPETVEVDAPYVSHFRKTRAGQLHHEGTLPWRKTHYLPWDLSDSDSLGSLYLHLAHLVEDRPSFVLMEGLTYRLPQASLDALFRMLQALQTKDSMIALDYWPEELPQRPVFRRARSFVQKRFGRSDCTLLEYKRLSALGGYEVIESSDIYQQEERTLRSNHLRNDPFSLPENYLVLRHK